MIHNKIIRNMVPQQYLDKSQQSIFISHEYIRLLDNAYTILSKSIKGKSIKNNYT
jgi:hypothetical protein